MKRSLSIATVGALGIVAALAAGSAAAAPSSSGTTFSGCLKPTGALYRVAAAPNFTYTCDGADRRVTWNSTGPQGLAGADGVNGAAGANGVNGTTGADGADGVNGAAGADGADGVNGIDGADGATGQTGAQGAGGATGQTGAHGEQGDVGPSGPPLLFFGTYSDSYWYRFGDVVEYEGSSYASLVPLNVGNIPGGENSTWGLVAAEGATGSQGIQGATGPQGEQGNQGDTGTQGVAGATGDTGPQGEQGNQGNQGNQGIQGDTGPQGNQGIQGDTGPQGDQGVQGPQGAQGATGDTGPSVGDTRTIVTDQISALDGFSTRTVSCTEGDVAMSGGWVIPNAGMTVIHSYPSATATNWDFKLNNSSGGAQNVTLYVVCIDGGNAPV